MRKTLAGPMAGFLFSLASGLSCAPALLPVPPVGDTYLPQDEKRPVLSSAEQELVDQVNDELARIGYSKAVPGSYETAAARVIANAGVAKHSGVAQGISRGSGLSGGTVEAPEEEGKIHVTRRLIEAGFPAIATSDVIVDYPQHRLESDQVKRLVRLLRPTTVYGDLRIGAAILASGWDNHRIFVVTLRDEQMDVTAPPPRTAPLSSSFTVEGRIVRASLPRLQLAVLRPDGHVDIVAASREGGTFRATYTFPQGDGRYLVSLGPGGGMYSVPVFVGVTPSPWPPVAAKGTQPPADAIELARQFGAALEKTRTDVGLASLPLPPELCGFARTLARERAKIHLEGKGSPLAWGSRKERRERFVTAGLAPGAVTRFNARVLGDGVPDMVAAFPFDAFQAAALRSARGMQLGVGVVHEAKESTDDDDFYHVVWMVLDRSTQASAPSAIR